MIQRQRTTMDVDLILFGPAEYKQSLQTKYSNFLVLSIKFFIFFFFLITEQILCKYANLSIFGINGPFTEEIYEWNFSTMVLKTLKDIIWQFTMYDFISN